MSTHQTAAEELLLPRITPLGDAALLVSFEGLRSDGRQAAAGLVEACRNQPLEGVLDIVQAFDRVGVYFDPNAPAFATVSPSARVAEWVRACWLGVSEAPAPTPRVHTIAVCYDREFSLDLPGLAAHAGLSVDEVIRRHSAAEYTVGAVGFAPGFAYLEGLPAELHTPRRDRPRTRVEEGAVAIGGPYTAIYPNASPGGWNLIGRCPRQLFDSQQDPPAVFQAGDRVRFEQIDRDRFAELKRNTAGQACRDEGGLTVLRIVSPGVQASLQDLGRGGARRWGVSAGGAMDVPALKIANALVGNPENAPVIEATLVGPVVECLSDCVIGVAGGVPERIGGARRLSVSCGERIDLRELTSGRIYLAVQGGFIATDVLGGRGTDLQAGFGGYAGRPLRAGDTLCRNGPPSEQGNREAGDWFVGRTPLRNHSDISLRVLPGPDRSAVDAEVWRTFLAAGYEVSSESNRMGIRLRGPCVPVEAGAVAASFPVGPGAIQIPPGGGPIVLSADSQTLGGYPVVACVVAADLPKLGQLRPAAIVRFAEVTMEQAECYRRAAERDLSITLAGIALANRGP